MKDHVAGTANRAVYDSMAHGEYLLGAPHLRHESIRNLYSEVVSRVFELAQRGGKPRPLVLDLGAGDGIATRPFLSRGAHVVAVDVSERQLEELRNNCHKYGGVLETRCDDVMNVLAEGRKYDVIVANSLLHHIPDYMALMESVAGALSDCGVFMSFQDPMWRSSMSKRDMLVSSAAYVSWRIWQGDVLGGLWRRFRRALGYYSESSPHDNTEYHAVRDGVDQNAIRDTLVARGFECSILQYCSLQSAVLQPAGVRLGIKNTFALLAARAS